MKLFGGRHSTNRTEKQHHVAKPVESSSGQKEKAATGKQAKSVKKHRLTGLQRGLILLGASILILAGVVFGVYKALVKPPELPTKPSLDKTTNEPNQKDPKKDLEPIRYLDDDGNEIEVEFEMPGSHVEGRYNILLVGTDGDGTRTDTIMIAHMDTVEHKVALMSVPRDTLIYGNYNVPKINSVYGGAGKGEKGIKALEKQLASILGFEVDGYAMVNLEAFVKVVDIIGGVPFNVPQRMYYNDPTQNLHIDLYAGEQVLDGQHAMQLVRFRSWASADIKRTETQRNFLKALAGELISLKTITKIQPIVETCIEYVDTDLTLGNILYFAQELFKCDLENMVSVSLPGYNTTTSGGGSYWGLYAKQVLEIVNESFNPYDTDISLGSLHIRTGSSSGGSTSSNKPSGGQTATKPPEPDPPVENPEEPNGSGALDPIPGVDPEDPNAPAEPTDPDKPTEPGEPGPEDPGTTPETPPDTTKPNDPSGTAPEDPGSSGTPGGTNPDTPQTPDLPNGSGILDVPSVES